MKTVISHSRLVLLFAALLSIPAVHGAIDKNFYKKTAEKVWAMDLPQFDPNADLSDSIYQNQSANYIARYISITADYDQDGNPVKFARTRIRNSNAISSKDLRRYMVKINDAAAAEYFTEFNVPADYDVTIEDYNIVKYRPCFGARVIKPDGTTTEVDMSKALTLTKGKKNEDDEYKVAVEGLEPGDVLDFFYFYDFWIDEKSLPSKKVNFLSKYPTKNFMLDCRIAPELTLEYGAYNGAPAINRFTKVDGRDRLFLEMENMESLDEEMPFFTAARQMPYLDIHILNNTGKIDFVPLGSRIGGIRLINPRFLMNDIVQALNKAKPDNKLVSSIVSITKDWMKSHPEATEQEICDAAWLAMSYTMIKNNETLQDRVMVVSFYKAIEKLGKIMVGTGVTSSRLQAPVSELVRFSDAKYMVRAAGRFYIPSSNIVRLPGFIPENYDREAFIMFNGSPEVTNLENFAEYGTLPPTKATDNEQKVKSVITLDFDNEEALAVESDISFSGYPKNLSGAMLSRRSVCDEYERFLGQKPINDLKNFDLVREEEKRNNKAKEFTENLWASEDFKLDSFEVITPGVVPDAPRTEIRFKGSVNGAVTEAGNNLMLNIGRFTGSQRVVSGDARVRDISIIDQGPHKYDCTIVVNIPEGYELVEESLQDLNRSIIVPEASFNASAESDGATVTIRVVERYPRSIYPAESWENILSVLDASADFNKASIVVRPK